MDQVVFLIKFCFACQSRQSKILVFTCRSYKCFFL